MQQLPQIELRCLLCQLLTSVPHEVRRDKQMPTKWLLLQDVQTKGETENKST